MEITGMLEYYLKQPTVAGISVNSANDRSLNTNIQFALPKIKLPEFDGKPTDWRSFIALFDRMVHNNRQIDNGIKIEYLKTSIRGRAAKVISHIDPTPENYETCYELIRNRYENKRLLLGAFLDNILFLPNLKTENVEQLKHMHDTINESLMSINNVGISIENWDSFLTHILIRKLDQNTLLHYECQLKDVREPQKLPAFLSYIENRFIALQSANVRADFNRNDSRAKQSQISTNDRTGSCLLCKETHELFKCQKFERKILKTG